MLTALKNHVERITRPIVRPIEQMGRKMEAELREVIWDATVAYDDILDMIERDLDNLKESIKGSLRSIFSRQDNHRPNISNR